MEIKELITQKLQQNFNNAELEFSEYRGEFNVKLNKKFINPVCKFLKEDAELEFLLCEDITAVDWAKRKNRFTVVYHIFSLKNKL
jgi:NADH-quinone oxidoreductase subunit C